MHLPRPRPTARSSRRRAGRLALALGCALALAGCAGEGGLGGALGRAGLGLPGAPLDEGTIAAGLRDALRVGTRNSVARTSATDGFLGNERIRIPLPEGLDPMVKALRAVGFGPRFDELEVAMNRAAEQAAGEAADVFIDAITAMTLADARQILEGSDTAATDYFRRTTSDPLRQRFAPIVEQKMAAVGLVRLYDDLTARFRALPLVGSQPTPDLESYVTDRALHGLFTVLGEEEKRIRTDPAARTTELLRTVFGRG